MEVLEHNLTISSAPWLPKFWGGRDISPAPCRSNRHWTPGDPDFGSWQGICPAPSSSMDFAFSLLFSPALYCLHSCWPSPLLASMNLFLAGTCWTWLQILSQSRVKSPSPSKLRIHPVCGVRSPQTQLPGNINKYYIFKNHYDNDEVKNAFKKAKAGRGLEGWQ